MLDNYARTEIAEASVMHESAEAAAIMPHPMLREREAISRIIYAMPVDEMPLVRAARRSAMIVSIVIDDNHRRFRRARASICLVNEGNARVSRGEKTAISRQARYLSKRRLKDAPANMGYHIPAESCMA